MIPRKTTLDVFIPEDRRHALAQGITLPTRTHGAVMFADISGFTRLTGIYSNELGSQRGAEALTQLFDSIYTELENAIHSFRGSVIVISGDGITCWFDQDDGRRGIACAFAMQKVMAKYETISVLGKQTIHLGIKIALSVGGAQRLLVGDPAIQFLEALVGRGVDQVVSVHDSLERGDVAISIDLVNKFSGSLSVLAQRQTTEGARFALVEEKSKLMDPDPWPEIPPLAVAVARRWVDRSVYSRIEGEEIEFLTELRQAVPLFVKFTGIDYDQDENAAEKLDQFVRCVQSVLERYEGYLCQLTIGGKGTNAFIAFGAPVAHEDNVDRALATALRLKEITAELGFIQPIRVGLTRGPLWAGAHGGGVTRTYSVIGLDVNLAHRLMSHAEAGQILVSPHVVDAAQGFSFTQLNPIHFKGIEKPITPFLLLGRAKSPVRSEARDTLFGRELERGILAMKLIELTSSRPADAAGVLLIEGEAGIGKSRLLTDFQDQAREKGIRVLYGEADPIERGTQYYVFRSILESLFVFSDADDPQMRKNKVTSYLEDPFLYERAPLLGDILPLPWSDNELTSQMSGEARAESIRDVVLGILRKAQSGYEPPVPLVLILDDAQWLDDASWDLFTYIVRELSTILFVIAMRPVAETETGVQKAQAYARMRENPATQRIQLSSLSLDDASHLIGEKLGIKSLPEFVVEFIWTRSQGNPFFTEQVAYALRDAGMIRIENEEVVINLAAEELHRIDFPDTVQGIITSRIDQLSPPQQLTLKVASVIGRVFLLKMLENVHPSKIGATALVDQLSMLTRLGITDCEASSGDLSYLFRHIITQEVVYGLLTFAQRKQLHCEIAEWYAKNHQEDQSAYYSRLAHHWLNGEVLEKAIFFLDKAGQQALELFSNEDVIRFISTAIELDERTHGKVFDLKLAPQRTIRRARWERMLGTAHTHMGQLPESLNHYRKALRLLGRPMPQTNAKIALSLIKELLIQFFHRIRMIKRGASRTNLHKQVEEELAQIAIHEVVFYSQNVALLLWATLHRLNLAERVKMPALMVEGYSSLLLIASFVHNERLINLYRRLTWEAVKQSNRTITRLYALVRDGVSLYLNCGWAEAGARFEAGARLADQLGDTRQLALLTASDATSHFLQGKYQESLQIWNNTYQRAIKKDRPQELAWGLYGQGHNMLMFGQLENAILNLEASLRVPMKSGEDKILNASRYGALSLAYFRIGQFDRAFENVIAHNKNATAPSASSIICYYSGIFDALLGLFGGILSGKTLLAESEAEQLEQLARRIPKSLKIMKNLPPNQAGVWLYKGMYDNLIGKHKEAIADWKKSLEYAQRFKQPYELGRASYELGQHLHAEDSSRRVYLAQACATFERLGTTYELNLAKSALEELTSASMD
jgi:class 3 adenylate cyclase/tetratricopeptide (TPR) repeat protein